MAFTWDNDTREQLLRDCSEVHAEVIHGLSPLDQIVASSAITLYVVLLAERGIVPLPVEAAFGERS